MSDKIYCPQIQAMTECDCSDKCDQWAIKVKKRVSNILHRALSGEDKNFRTEGGFIRWGLVEREMHEAIDGE